MIDQRGHLTQPHGPPVLFCGLTLTSGNHPNEAEAFANSRLIAAAPEMLEALQAVMARPKNTLQWRDTYTLVVAAIAKAEGTS